MNSFLETLFKPGPSKVLFTICRHRHQPIWQSQYRYHNQYRPKWKSEISVVIGIGQYEKRFIGHTLNLQPLYIKQEYFKGWGSQFFDIQPGLIYNILRCFPLSIYWAYDFSVITIFPLPHHHSSSNQKSNQFTKSTMKV